MIVSKIKWERSSSCCSETQTPEPNLFSCFLLRKMFKSTFRIYFIFFPLIAVPAMMWISLQHTRNNKAGHSWYDSGKSWEGKLIFFQLILVISPETVHWHEKKSPERGAMIEIHSVHSIRLGGLSLNLLLRRKQLEYFLIKWRRLVLWTVSDQKNFYKAIDVYFFNALLTDSQNLLLLRSRCCISRNTKGTSQTYSGSFILQRLMHLTSHAVLFPLKMLSFSTDWVSSCKYSYNITETSIVFTNTNAKEAIGVYCDGWSSLRNAPAYTTLKPLNEVHVIKTKELLLFAGEA